MQLCMTENHWEESWIGERIGEAVRKNLVNIVRIGMTAEEALIEVKARAKGLIVFARKYLGGRPKVCKNNSISVECTFINDVLIA